MYDLSQDVLTLLVQPIWVTQGSPNWLTKGLTSWGVLGRVIREYKLLPTMAMKVDLGGNKDSAIHWTGGVIISTSLIC